MNATLPFDASRLSFGRVAILVAIPWAVLIVAMLSCRAAASAVSPAAALLMRGVVPALAAIAATVLCERFASRKSFPESARALGFRRPHREQVRIALIAMLPIALAYVVVFAVVRVPFVTESMLPLVLIKYALAQGIAEEVLFRGLAFRWLRRGRTFGRAALLSAVLFAVVHLTNLLKGMSAEVVIGMALSTVYAFILAFPMALLFERGSGSIVGVALLHFAIDSNNWFPAMGESVPALLVYVVGGTFGALVVVIVLTRKWLPPSQSQSPPPTHG